MTQHVLDLIDNVVAEHELLSADAMRWTPDAPGPTPAAACTCNWCARYGAGTCADDAPIDITGFIRDVTGVQMTPWQYELVGRIFKVPVQMLLSRAEVERRVRLRRMHSDYRRRNRGR